MKNGLWCLGFLGPLSLLYFFMGEVGFLGFAIFALYFTIYKENDERLEINAGLATRNAFLYAVLVGAISLFYINISQDKSFFPIAFVSMFSSSIVISVLSYGYYNSKGEKV
jgi:peptidoglycan biosynthesis protein MviN/MurJ (putative lipid II flippase)